MTKMSIGLKHPPRPVLKALMLMNGITLLLLTLTLSVSATGFSQKEISPDAKNIPLTAVLKQIENNSFYRFVYSSDMQDGKMVSIERFSNASLSRVMESLLSNTTLTYNTTNDGQVNIVERKQGLVIVK